MNRRRKIMENSVMVKTASSVSIAGTDDQAHESHLSKPKGIVREDKQENLISAKADDSYRPQNLRTLRSRRKNKVRIINYFV